MAEHRLHFSNTFLIGLCYVMPSGYMQGVCGGGLAMQGTCKSLPGQPWKTPRQLHTMGLEHSHGHCPSFDGLQGFDGIMGAFQNNCLVSYLQWAVPKLTRLLSAPLLKVELLVV